MTSYALSSSKQQETKKALSTYLVPWISIKQGLNKKDRDVNMNIKT